MIESFSQNVDEDADEANAVEVKLITGLSTIWTSISGEKEEQPCALKDSPLNLLPPMSVLVVSILDPYFTPIGLSSK